MYIHTDMDDIFGNSAKRDELGEDSGIAKADVFLKSTDTSEFTESPISFNANGFQPNSVSYDTNLSGETFIYMAIREAT